MDVIEDGESRVALQRRAQITIDVRDNGHYWHSVRLVDNVTGKEFAMRQFTSRDAAMDFARGLAQWFSGNGIVSCELEEW